MTNHLLFSYTEFVHDEEPAPTPRNSGARVLNLWGNTPREPEPVRSFEPLVNWLDDYTNCGAAKVSVEFDFNYATADTQIMLKAVMQKLERVNEEHNNVSNVRWLYPERSDEMRCLGYNLSNVSSLPFEYTSYAA